MIRLDLYFISRQWDIDVLTFLFDFLQKSLSSIKFFFLLALSTGLKVVACNEICAFFVTQQFGRKSQQSDIRKIVTIVTWRDVRCTVFFDISKLH